MFESSEVLSISHENSIGGNSVLVVVAELEDGSSVFLASIFFLSVTIASLVLEESCIHLSIITQN